MHLPTSNYTATTLWHNGNALQQQIAASICHASLAGSINWPLPIVKAMHIGQSTTATNKYVILAQTPRSKQGTKRHEVILATGLPLRIVSSKAYTSKAMAKQQYRKYCKQQL